MGKVLYKIAFALLGGALIGYVSSLAFPDESIWPNLIGILGAFGLIIMAFRSSGSSGSS